jgi:hypothetical protein
MGVMGLFKRALGFALILQGLFGAVIFASIPGFSGLAVLEVLFLILGIVLLTRK